MLDRDSLQSWGIQGARHTYASFFDKIKKKHNKNKIDWIKES